MVGKETASSKPLEPGRALPWGDSQKTEVAWAEEPREESEGSEGWRGADVRLGLLKPWQEPWISLGVEGEPLELQAKA